MNNYQLPNLPYGYDDLMPFMSEEQLRIHHQKHHQAYVNGVNSTLEKLEKARGEGTGLEMKAILKDLSFYVSGHILHSLFWENLSPANKGGEPSFKILELLRKGFTSLEQFKKEFTQAAISIEGSGWAALAIEGNTEQPLIIQIEKHNNFFIPNTKILLVLDFWEHAYYIDYKNEKAKFAEGFWNFINWNEVEKRL